MKTGTIKVYLKAGDKKVIRQRAKEAGIFQIRNGKKEVNLSEYARLASLGQIKN